MTGMRPVVEVMYPDFTLYAADSIANQAAKYRYMCGGGSFKVPVVFRIAGSGSSNGSGCHHGQSLEATFIHFPGLKVVFPSTPYDAKGLIKTAIREDNPVLFYEHKLLYGVKGEVPVEEYTLPIGKAEVKREGSDVTIVSYGWTLHKALRAAEQLASDGIDAEVIDLRSLRPMDKECILHSLKKTSKLVTAEEGTKMGGVGAEIAAIVAEEGLHLLDGPSGGTDGAAGDGMRFGGPPQEVNGQRMADNGQLTAERSGTQDRSRSTLNCQLSSRPIRSARWGRRA